MFKIRDGGLMLLATLFGQFPFLKKLFADSAYAGPVFHDGLANIMPNLVTEIVRRSDRAKGFVVLPKRWIVERTIGWLGRCRRLAKDRENLNHNALDNPTFGQNDEALGPIGTTDDFSDQVRHDVREAVMEHRPCVGAVSEQLLEEWELSEQCGQEHQATVAILNIGWRHQRMQQQTQCIDENVALLPLISLPASNPWASMLAPLFPRFSRSGYRRCRQWDWPRLCPARGI